MGRFFTEEIEEKPKNPILKYIIIGASFFVIYILVIIIISINSQKNSYELKGEGLSIGINEVYPDPMDFFKKINPELKVEADYSKCDNTKIGDCEVTLSGDIKKTTAVLHIKDFTPPELTLKEEVKLNIGETYTAEDFVEECSDNLEGECTIYFYDKATDEAGNEIDYSAYTEKGEYKVKIFAKDINGNESDVLESTLIIGDSSISCEYGSNEYDEEKYSSPISVSLAVDGCAINGTLYKEESNQALANEVYNKDYKNLQKDMDSILKKEYPQGAYITVCPAYISIFNKEGKGLVGYSIYVKVYIDTVRKLECTDEGIEEYKVVSYYIDKDNSRIYEVNKYDI